MALTRGHLLRHFQGRTGGFYPAMLDVAQDHLLAHLYGQGLFDLGLVFKGGTSLRKMRSGAGGRFSTDLDFSTTEPDVASLVLEAVDGAQVGPFTFTVANRDEASGRADLHIVAPFGPQPAQTDATSIDLPAKVEISSRPPWLPFEKMPFLRLPVHASYDIADLPALPVVRVEEAIAEKLARYARVPLARDLFDLIWYGHAGAMNEPLIRRLWVLKVYNDLVIEGRWSKRRFTPSAILTPRASHDIDDENIGYLTQPIDIDGWEREFRRRYRFLVDVTAEEQVWAECHAGRRYEFTQLIASLSSG
ncbi:nucleotidyl transferase AbiEii/AbiGii toxin family protein [Actinopolymorpha sp. B11F2]|uniref:nucleotidyl transferase AbiEii/AbiGii toxin family protein n=1 Tax=Actinopolymorpha sp. B11F2 TaxID=3160862 RepID=UPI0032E38C62